jgi:hypothetical protein
VQAADAGQQLKRLGPGLEREPVQAGIAEKIAPASGSADLDGAPETSGQIQAG